MWHKLTFPCPKCDRQTAILRISACANGEMLMDCVCATCGITLGFKTDIQKILTTCVEADVLYPMEEQMEVNDGD